MLMWWGVAGVAVSMNAGPGIAAAAVASPLFVTLLLTKVREGRKEKGAMYCSTVP
jgi:steroid 5-alpha reductase family enzyme